MDMKFAGLLLIALLTLAACGPTQSNSHSGDSDSKYCRADAGSTLVLIDTTTPLDDTDKRNIAESLESIFTSLAYGDRMVLATIESHYSQTESLVNACKPGCPDQQNAVNTIINGCGGIQTEQDGKAFERSVAAALIPIFRRAEEQPNSDIIRTISIWTSNPPGGQTYSEVIVFSDMLENSQVFTWAQFSAVRHEASMSRIRDLSLVPKLDGATIRVVGFGRGHEESRKPLPLEVDNNIRKFWQAYAEEGNGQVSFEGAIRN